MRTAQEAQELFQRHVQGKNFMTPVVVRYGWAGKHAYELSQGEGFERETIYGVTVVDETGRRTDLSKGAFHSMNEVRDYLAWVREAI